MKVAITGSNGFIGKKLVNSLKKLDIETIGIDLQTGVDIMSWKEIEKISEFDILVHLAARIFIPDSFSRPNEFYNLNIIGTLNALELCKRNNSKMIFVSSYVYGHPQYLPIDEKHPVQPANPYTRSKIIGESLCEGYHNDFGVPVIILRPFNVFGPDQKDFFLISKILSKIKSGKVELIEPNSRRDYLYVDDLIGALLKAINHKNLSFDIFNIGFGKSYSVAEIIEIISKYSPNKFSVSYSHEQRVNEVLDTVANINKAKDILNWQPTISFEEGISLTLKESNI